MMKLPSATSRPVWMTKYVVVAFSAASIDIKASMMKNGTQIMNRASSMGPIGFDVMILV
jgi:hypothetical protein